MLVSSGTNFQMDTDLQPACPFLDLPIELRLIIYDFALKDNPVVTIGCAEIVGDHPSILQRLYGGDRTPYPGIPPNTEPIVETSYVPSLLSLVSPAIIPLDPDMSDEPEEVFEDSSVMHQSLLLVSRRVRDEVKAHCLVRNNQPSTSLFLQYPYGLHIMRNSAHNLLHQARSIHLAGVYRPFGFCAQRAAYFGPLVLQNQEQSYGSLSGTHSRDSASQLADLVSSIFGSESQAKHTGVEMFEMRIYYPGQDSYSIVWGDEKSPTSIALCNIEAAQIDIEVWRGKFGTGIYLSAKRSTNGTREVSTVWRRLEEGRRHEPPCGTWVVDPKWPYWEDVQADTSDAQF